MTRNAIPLKNLLLVNTVLLGIVSLMSCRTMISVVYVVFFLGFMALSAAIDVCDRKHPSRLLLDSASILILMASVLRMRFDNFIVVFTEAILLMTAVKMIEKKRSRDYCQIAALSAFTLVSASVDAVDGTYIYYGVIESILVGFQFIYAAWFTRAPDSSLKPEEFFQTGGRVSVIWIIMLPICIIVFFAMPRARLTMGQIQMAGVKSTVGFSDRIALGSVRSIQEVNALAFRAEMPMIAPKYLFWRGLVMDVFDGREWFSVGRRRPERLVSRGTDTVKQEIFIENGRFMKSLFALEVPLIVNAPDLMYMADGVFVNVNSRNRIRSYSAISSLSDRFSLPSGNINREHYMRLPENFSPPIKALVGEIMSGVNDGDKPEAIMKYLSPPAFLYSLDDLPVSLNPLDEFLFNSKKGNCEFYATAMAVMLRIAGVPSRLVAGYHGGVYNDSGGYYVVSQSNAHAWVEAWDETDHSWRRYDPTPISQEVGDSVNGESNYGFLWQYFDYLNYHLSRIFMEYEGDTQSKLLDSLKEFFASPGEALGAFLDKFYNDKKKTYVVASIAILICLAFAAPKCLRRRKARMRRDRDDILRDRFLLAMKRRGFIKRSGDGLEEFTREVMARLGASDVISLAVFEFVLSFEAYYFRDIPIEPPEFRRLEDIIKSINKYRTHP